jgi:hypothetical protein
MVSMKYNTEILYSVFSIVERIMRRERIVKKPVFFVVFLYHNNQMYVYKSIYYSIV